MKKQGITVAYIYNASFSLRVFIGFWNESKGFFHIGFLLTYIFRGVVPDAVFFANVCRPPLRFDALQMRILCMRLHRKSNRLKKMRFFVIAYSRI